MCLPAHTRVSLCNRTRLKQTQCHEAGFRDTGQEKFNRRPVVPTSNRDD